MYVCVHTCACMCAHAFVPVHAHPYVCLWFLWKGMRVLAMHTCTQSCGSRGQLQVLFLRLCQPLVWFFKCAFWGYHTRFLGLQGNYFTGWAVSLATVFVCLFVGGAVVSLWSLGWAQLSNKSESVTGDSHHTHLTGPDWPCGTAAGRLEARVGISLCGCWDVKSLFWNKSSVRRINGEKCHSPLSVQWKASEHHHLQQQSTAEPLLRQESRTHSSLAALGQVAEVLSAPACHLPQSAHCVWRVWKLPASEIQPNRFLPVCVGRLGIRQKQHNVKKLLFNWIWWFICPRFRRKGWESVMSFLSAGNTLHGHGHHCLPEQQLTKLHSELPCLLQPSKLFNTNSHVVTLCVSNLFKFAMGNQSLGETRKVCSD